MSLPDTRTLATTRGYFPDPLQAEALLQTSIFDEVLTIGLPVSDADTTVRESRFVSNPEIQLPEGVYWFATTEPASALVVNHGSQPGAPVTEAPTDAADASLDAALSWFDHLWETSKAVPRPRYPRDGEVLTQSGQDGIVRQRRFTGHDWMYRVFVDGENRSYHESALDPRPLVDSAEAWVRESPSSAAAFAATLSRAKLQQAFTDTVFSFRATRTLFRPYQFKPVLKFLSSGSLRLLIADEVGLGKTIEAGLLWTELEARRQADRVLIVCPSSLAAKWRREMDERFGFELEELTMSGLADLREGLESGRVPQRKAYICTLERLRRWPNLEHVTTLNLHFDLVIVDEAHTMRNSGTKSHHLGEHLTQWASALVFLSATPVNLQSNDLYNLLDILVPGEFEDLQGLADRIAPNAALHKVTRSLLDPDVTSSQRLEWLDELKDLSFGEVLRRRPDFVLLRQLLALPQLTAEEVVQVKRIISEMHGLSAQLTRTRKVDVDEAKALREPRSIPVHWNQEEHAFYTAYLEWCVRRAQAKGQPLHFCMQMPLRLAGSCLPEAARSVLAWNENQEVADEVDSTQATRPSGPDVPPDAKLLQLAAGVVTDTKLAQLDVLVSDLLRQGRQALLFTFSRKTLARLEAHLSRTCRVGVLHGGVPKHARDPIMEAFRRREYDVVLATKVASEGLDFEFCSVLINYDLPWNPMEIEQRIGRIDRIGQVEDKIQIFNFSTPGTIETDILERVFARIKIFEEAIGDLEPIIAETWTEFESNLLDFTLTGEQRRQRTMEISAAIEEKRQALRDVDDAAPMLISSDGVDIEGLEGDLVASGRYVGQEELALLVSHWIESDGGKTERVGPRLIVKGTDVHAGHLESLVRSRSQSAAEVVELQAQLRENREIYLCLDQEVARQTGETLLTATHPLVRAALTVPGHRQSRFASIRLDSADGYDPGTYLVHLSVATWDGVRPSRQIWSRTVDLHTGNLTADLGDRVLAAVAAGRLAQGGRTSLNLDVGIRSAIAARDQMQIERNIDLQQENSAFVDARRLGAQQAHERRMASHRQAKETLLANRRQDSLIRARDALIEREIRRHDEFLADLDRRSGATLSTEDLAVCIVEVC